MEDESQLCQNCHCTIKEEENYCSICGQKKITTPLSIWELSKEFATTTLSFDSKISRTLFPLFFLPGKLTKEYLEGKRAKYFSPVKLFIFFLTTNLLMLAMISDYDNTGNDVERKVMHQFLLDSLKTQFQTAGLDHKTNHLVDSVLHQNQLLELEHSSFSLQLSSNSPLFKIKTIDAFRYDIDSLMVIYNIRPNNIFEHIAFAQYVKAVKNPNSFVQYIFTHISWAIFFIIPLVTLLLKLLYLRKKSYTEHLVFVLHLHTFAFGILTLLMANFQLTRKEMSDTIWPSLLFFYILGYIYFALKTVYQSSAKGILLRIFVFAIGYAITATIAILVLTLLSFALF